MKKKTYDFSPPPIMGTLGDKTLTRRYASTFEREIKRRGIHAVCLPFRVSPRHLKNVVACMKLMDIAGMAVHPSLQKHMMKRLPNVEKRAREAGFVDVVVRRNNRFVGMNARSRAVEKGTSTTGAILDLIFG
jgi:shikimate 5-dehydrogenase